MGGVHPGAAQSQAMTNQVLRRIGAGAAPSLAPMFRAVVRKLNGKATFCPATPATVARFVRGLRRASASSGFIRGAGDLEIARRWEPRRPDARRRSRRRDRRVPQPFPRRARGLTTANAFQIAAVRLVWACCRIFMKPGAESGAATAQNDAAITRQKLTASQRRQRKMTEGAGMWQ